MLKIHGKSRCEYFSLIMTDNGQFTVLRYNCVKYKFFTATEIVMVITILKKNEKIGSKWSTFI